MITPPLSPRQETSEQNTATDTPDGTQETRRDGSVSSGDYIFPEKNGTNMETFLPSKPQTHQHKFLAAGQQKSLSSGNFFAGTKESDEEENRLTLVKDSDSMQDQILKETGNGSSKLPDVKIDQSNQTDDSMENLFNV